MRFSSRMPNNTFLSPDRYNQIFTTHGTTMMFLFAVPMMEGMGIYLVPLMLGTRNVAFPRLNAFGYWMYLFGRHSSLRRGFFTNTGPDAGWFAYPPLSGPQFSPGKRVDIWAQMITFTEISALCVATEIIVTILKMRAPGMSLNRIPMFCWSMLVQSFMVIFAMPAVMIASTVMLLNDRTIGTHFVNPAEGGDPLLYQQSSGSSAIRRSTSSFIPALGMVSSIVEAIRAAQFSAIRPWSCRWSRTGFIGFRLVGASYVRHRSAANRRGLLHRGEHDDRDYQRRPDLLLARDALDRPAAAHTPRCTSCSDSSSFS